MKTIGKSGLASLLMTGLVVLTACNSGTGKKKTTKVNKDATRIEKKEVETHVREFVYPLPNSYEIVEMLNKIEASYIFGLPNNPKNADAYFTERSAALNLGVYGADLSYSSTYNQKQETLDYLAATHKMLDGLDLSNAVDSNLPAKIKKNQENKDVLIDLITNSFYDTYDYLLKNKRESVSAIFMTGAWVEGLYIATHVSEETFNSSEMINIILKQKDPLNKLMDILNKFKNKSDVAKTIKELKPLADIYAKIAPDAINHAQMENIKKQVGIVRASFVKVK